jgi:cytochrome c551/c552
VSDKDKNKPVGTSDKAPLDSMAAGAEEPATSPTSIVAHPSDEHEKAPAREPVDLDAPTALDDGQDSPMLGFAALVLVVVIVATTAIAQMTVKDGPLLLENRTQPISANGMILPTVAVVASQVAAASMAPIPGVPHVPDSNAPPAAPVAPAPPPAPANSAVATAGSASSAPSWQDGEAIFKNPVNACATCHSTDGSKLVGPSLKDKYGATETLADGSTVTVDDAYIKESLLDPTAKVVQGYPPAMPSQAGKFSDAQIESVILFLRHIAGKDPAP